MGRGAADLHAVAGVLPYEIEPGSGQTDMVKLRIARQGALAGRDLGRDPEGAARRAPRRRWRSRSSARSSPCPPISTTPRARRPAMPRASPASKCCAWSTSRPRRRWPTAWTRGRRASSRSTIWAAAPSTSPCCGWRRACSRCWRPAATPRSAATTSTAPSPSACSGERKKDGLGDQVDEAAVKTALALARHMKEQLSDRDQTSGRLELAGVPSFHALTRAEFEAMIAELRRAHASTSPAACWATPA